jgi:hypothetical protein
LDGGAGLNCLAESYIRWFREKAEIRVSELANQECETALRAIARRFRGVPARVGKKWADWLSPCMAATRCAELLARRLLEEATTAGMVVEEEQFADRWRWRHTWLCEYLGRGEGAQNE